MALQEEGWPLGLLNGRIGMIEASSDFSGSILTESPTSFGHSSSDLESQVQSPGLLFHEKTTTLGTLMDDSDSSLLEVSKRPSTKGRKGVVDPNNKKSHNKMKPWLMSLCSRQSTDAMTPVSVKKEGPSCLGHYLEAERRAAAPCRFNNVASHFRPIKRSKSLSL